MTTIETMIDAFIELGVKSVKKLYKETLEGRKLDRHEIVILDDGTDCRCWREYVVYKMAQLIRDVAPEADIEVDLNGNESTLYAELSNVEQQQLKARMKPLLEKDVA